MSPHKKDSFKHSDLFKNSHLEEKNKPIEKYENYYIHDYTQAHKEIPEEFSSNMEAISSKSTLRRELNNVDKEILELQNKLKNYD